MIKKKDFEPFFLYPKPRKKMLEDWKKGEAPDHFLWGLNYLVGKNHENYFSDISFSRWNLLHWLFLPLEKYLIKKTGTGFKIDQAILLFPKMVKADVVIAVADSTALPVAFLKWLGVLKTPVIYITIGLAPKLKQKKTCNLIIRFYHKLLSSVEKIVVLSKREQDILKEALKIKGNKIKLIPFGIDYQFFNKPTQEDNFILSVGRDPNRDYVTLFTTARLIPDQKFIVVTSKANIKGLSIPNNIEIKLDISYKDLRSLYLKAKIFVLPLKENFRASGQTAFLEALSSGLAVIAADIQGLRDYNFKNKKYCLFFKPGSSFSLQEKLDFLLKSLSCNKAGIKKDIKEGQRIIRQKFNSEITAKKIKGIIKEISRK